MEITKKEIALKVILEDANGNTQQDIDDAEKNCPKGYIVVWNRWEKGFKYRKLDKDGYVMSIEEEGKIDYSPIDH
jgi:hypothetical protein